MTSVRMKDIAAELGVSVSTVSRAINNRCSGGNSAQEDVWRVARKLGYKPKASERARRKLGQIALVALGMHRPGEAGDLSRLSYPASGYYGQFVCGVERAVRKGDGALRVQNVDGGPDLISRACEAIDSIRSDGTIVLGGFGLENVGPLCERQPLVLLNVARQSIPADCVVPDDEGGVVMIMERLVGLGHRRIAFWEDRDRDGRIEPRPQRRLEGYREGLRRFGLSYERTYCEARGEGSFIERMTKGFEAYLDDREPPTAIIASCDLLAYGLLRLAHTHEIKIPDVLSIVGYDDVEMSAHTYPALSTINTNGELMGREAVEVLTRRLRHPDVPYRQVILRGRLVERESSGPAPREG